MTKKAGPPRATKWGLTPSNLSKIAAFQGERNASNYSGVLFGRILFRDAVDCAMREEINNAIAVK